MMCYHRKMTTISSNNEEDIFEPTNASRNLFLRRKSFGRAAAWKYLTKNAEAERRLSLTWRLMALVVDDHVHIEC